MARQGALTEWPICPISGDPEAPESVLVALVLRSGLPHSDKLRLVKALGLGCVGLRGREGVPSV